MIQNAVLEAAERYVREFFAQDASGHDWHHTMRVRRTAARIAAEEGADGGVVALAALLHDVDDAKLSPQTAEGLLNACCFMEEQSVAEEDRQAVLTAIREVSFSKNGAAAPSSVEAACVRDADRLDAIGAIGVARAFAFGGAFFRLSDPHFPARTASARLLSTTSPKGGRAVSSPAESITSSSRSKSAASMTSSRFQESVSR